MDESEKGVNVMANAKKCDICGKFYDFYITNHTDPRHINGVGFFEIDRKSASAREILDSCPECLYKILEFIESLKGEK